MAQVAIRNVSKAFGSVQVLHGIDVDIADGEFVALVGPSGCGKSTLLRMIAGLEAVTGGTIAIGDRIVNHLPPSERDIAMVFQNYALYPHKTVAQNMGFALKMRGIDKAQIDERVRKAADILDLTPYLERYPRQLSGGQRQRVAMGRAIVRNPKVFLFDEPLSDLDAKLRVQMRAEIKELHQRLKTTTIYVTHDQVEAMTMADKIVVMQAGRIEQVGAPLELFDRPANTFVAGFIGSPAMNIVRRYLTRQDRGRKGSVGSRPPGPGRCRSVLDLRRPGHHRQPARPGGAAGVDDDPAALGRRAGLSAVEALDSAVLGALEVLLLEARGGGAEAFPDRRLDRPGVAQRRQHQAAAGIADHHHDLHVRLRVPDAALHAVQPDLGERRLDPGHPGRVDRFAGMRRRHAAGQEGVEEQPGVGGLVGLGLLRRSRPARRRQRSEDQRAVNPGPDSPHAHRAPARIVTPTPYRSGMRAQPRRPIAGL